MKKRSTTIWSITDHICSKCGTRILRQEGSYISGGGNSIYHCADCGATGSDLSEGGGICWCSYHLKHQHTNPYTCVPFSLIEELEDAGRTNAANALNNAFLMCGCDPRRGKVGIMLKASYSDALGKDDK